MWLSMQLVPAVTELVISELLWLNFSSPEKPVYVYLHSIGSQTPDGQAVGFDTEAYAILDTLAYIRPEIHTLVLGQVSMIPGTCSSAAPGPWLTCMMRTASNASSQGCLSCEEFLRPASELGLHRYIGLKQCITCGHKRCVLWSR